MWFIAIVTIWNIILQSNIVFSENLYENIGPIQLHTKIGRLQQKYKPLDKEDQKASRKVAALMELAKFAFPTGYGAMPPLDPYTQKKTQTIELNTHELLSRWKLLSYRIYFNSKLNLKNLVVTGGQNFSLHHLELRLKNFRTDISVSVPKLSLEVDFEVDATESWEALMLGGHLSIELMDVSLSVAVGAGTVTTSVNQQVFQLISADVVGRSQNLQMHISNLYLGGYRMEWIEDLSMAHCIQVFKDDLALALVKVALDKVNTVLENITVDLTLTVLLS